MRLALAVFAGITLQSALAPTVVAAEKLAALSGTVNVDGRPVTYGRIFLYVDANQFIGVRISKNGTFHLKQIPAGFYKASIEGDRIHNRYRAEDTSGLSVELESGPSNTWVIELRS